MPVLKFKNLEDLDRLEREGKGISWQFTPDKIYLRKALQFQILKQLLIKISQQIKIPFPPGLYKFKTFEEAEKWEREWWIGSGD